MHTPHSQACTVSPFQGVTGESVHEGLAVWLSEVPDRECVSKLCFHLLSRQRARPN